MKDSNKEEQQSEKVTMNVTINPPLQFTGEEDALNEGDIPEAIPDDSDEEAYRHRSMMIRGSSFQDRRMNNRSSEDQTVSTSQVPDIHP